jgi:hypothetical protein
MSDMYIYEKKYHEVFEETVEYLESRRRNDPSFTFQSLENCMRALYAQQGNNWEGRGELLDTVHDATIAAYEHIWAAWKNELESEGR